MVKIGLLGLPKSGKTTIFNAVTGSDAKIKDYISQKEKPNIATIKVFDERLQYLSEIFQPQKTIYSAIEYIDFMGLSEDDKKGELFSSKYLSDLKTVDALAFVLRNFELPGKQTDSVSELEIINNELLFSDLSVCENRINTIKKQNKRGVTSADLDFELKLMRKCHERLNASKPLRQMDFNKEEQKILNSFQFLTQKPVMIIINESVDNFASEESITKEMPNELTCVEIAGKFELELNELEEEERQMFMVEYGINDSAINKLTRVSYDTLGLITFFTVGDDEVRAWAIRKSSTALQAADKVHTDLARGFIRAERFRISDLKEYSSINALKNNGKLYLEGKQYVVRDGDVIKIRHN
ncbi:MAG: redox-regulated ATPase YchF [Candidatus Cloacimonetes bacterium]|nr:redox-regulated ATPase YchF [Candidatus Cloacimonadota bacterium]